MATEGNRAFNWKATAILMAAVAVVAAAGLVAAAVGAFSGDEGATIVQGPARADTGENAADAGDDTTDAAEDGSEADEDTEDEGEDGEMTGDNLPPAAGGVQTAAAAPGAARAWNGPRRPALEYRRGRVFGYLLPQGWRVNESDNGIELVAPDGVTAVVGSIVLGAAGQPTPEGYLRDNLARVGQAGARFVSVRPAEEWPGPAPGFVWRGIEAEIESQQNGRPTHIRATSHVLQGAGQYSAIVTGAQSPREQWEAVRDWLPRVRDGIRIVNGSIPGASMAAALPRGIRHDEIYGRFNDAWTARQVPAADLSQARREGTMGYVRLVDPETDRIWELPLEAYDPTVGGYRNPAKPDLLLQRARN